MILYAMVVRARDGLILCDSTDVKETGDKDLKLGKKCMKQLARKLRRFDDRCLLQVSRFTICCVTSLDVGYLALCEASYADVLAFGFLEEMLKQFIKIYDVPTVDAACRPFSFIEFDKVIQKLRQKYNTKTGVVQRLNFGALTEELRLRPPTVIGRNEVEDVSLPPSSYGAGGDDACLGPGGQNGHFHNSTRKPWPREEIVMAPLSCASVTFVVLVGLLAAMNFYRGVVSVHLANVYEFDGPTVTHGVTLILECLLQCSLIYCLISSSPGREFGSIASTVLEFWCDVYLWNIREEWLSILQLICAVALSYFTLNRDYSVKATRFSV